MVQSRNGEMTCQCGARRSSYASFVEKVHEPESASFSARCTSLVEIISEVETRFRRDLFAIFCVTPAEI